VVYIGLIYQGLPKQSRIRDLGYGQLSLAGYDSVLLTGLRIRM